MRAKRNKPQDVLGNNPDRISKSDAWEAKLHLQLWHRELLRCCEIPSQGRAQAAGVGRREKLTLNIFGN